METRWSSARTGPSRKPLRGVAAALMLGLCLLVSACSSSSHSSPSDNGGLSGAPIKVGTIQTVTGPTGSKLSQTLAGVWQKWVNTHGGINGHPVQLIVLDDAGNPSQALSVTRKLVTQDHVVAIIGTSTYAGPPVLKVASAAHVPLIGGITASEPGVSGPYAYQAQVGLITLNRAAFEIAKSLGVKKWGDFYCSPGCQNVPAMDAQSAKATGLTDAYEGAVSFTAPDYTGPCLKMVGSGADAATVAGTAVMTKQIVKACQQSGFKGDWMLNAGVASPFWDKDPSFATTKIHLISDVWPWFDTSTPARQEFQDAMAKYAPGMTTDPSYNAFIADEWVGFQMFKKAAENVKLGPNSSSADVIKGLATIKNETLGGLTGPVTYDTSASSHPDNCYYQSELKNGKWVSDGSTSTCLNG